MENEKLDLLNELTFQLVRDIGQRNVEYLLDEILRNVCKHFHAEVGAIFLDEEAKDIYICKIAYGFGERLKNEKKGYRKGQGLTGYLLEFSLPMMINGHQDLISKKLMLKIDSKGEYDQELWDKNKKKFENMIGVPLITNKKTLGIIKVENKNRGKDKFTEEDFLFLKNIASSIALAIDYTRTLKKSENKKNALILVEKIVHQKDDKFNEAANLIMELFDSDLCFIFLSDNNKTLKCVGGAGPAKMAVGKNDVTYKIGERDGLTGAIADNDQLCIINNLEYLISLRKEKAAESKADKYTSDRGTFKNLIGIPLKIDNQVIGVLKVEDKKTGDFNKEDAELIMEISKICPPIFYRFYHGVEQHASNSSTKTNRINTPNNIEEDTYDKAMSFIKSGKVLEAIELGLNVSSKNEFTEYHKALILQSSMFNMYKEKQRLGIDDKEKTDLNKIIVVIIDIFHKMRNTEK